MYCQYPPDDVLIELDPKSVRQLLRDSRTTKAWVALFEFDDRADQFNCRPLWPWLALAGPGIEPPVLAPLERRMKTEQGGRLDDHGAAQNPLRVQKQRPKPQQHPLVGVEVRGASPPAPKHKQLLFQEQILGNNRLDSASPSSDASVTVKCTISPKMNFITAQFTAELSIRHAQGPGADTRF